MRVLFAVLPGVTGGGALLGVVDIALDEFIVVEPCSTNDVAAVSVVLFPRNISVSHPSVGPAYA